MTIPWIRTIQQTIRSVPPSPYPAISLVRVARLDKKSLKLSSWYVVIMDVVKEAVADMTVMPPQNNVTMFWAQKLILAKALFSICWNQHHGPFTGVQITFNTVDSFLLLLTSLVQSKQSVSHHMVSIWMTWSNPTGGSSADWWAKGWTWRTDDKIIVSCQPGCEELWSR